MDLFQFFSDIPVNSYKFHIQRVLGSGTIVLSSLHSYSFFQPHLQIQLASSNTQGKKKQKKTLKHNTAAKFCLLSKCLKTFSIVSLVPQPELTFEESQKSIQDKVILPCDLKQRSNCSLTQQQPVIKYLQNHSLSFRSQRSYNQEKELRY